MGLSVGEEDGGDAVKNVEGTWHESFTTSRVRSNFVLLRVGAR